MIPTPVAHLHVAETQALEPLMVHRWTALTSLSLLYRLQCAFCTTASKPQLFRLMHSCADNRDVYSQQQGLVPLLEKYPIVDIRGRGLMSALEFGGRDGSLHAEPGTAAKLVKAANERGLLILAAGTHRLILQAHMPLRT